MSEPTIREVKLHLDGRREVFLCQALEVTPQRAVVAFVTERDLVLPQGVVRKGTVTYGFFWRRRPYILYRFVSPEGEVRGHRFDVVEGVRIAPDRVEYTDLLLDLFVASDGALRVEDEDEVAEYAARGLLTPAQRQRIARTRAFLLASHRRVIGEAEGALAAVVALPP